MTIAPSATGTGRRAGIFSGIDVMVTLAKGAGLITPLEWIVRKRLAQLSY